MINKIVLASKSKVRKKILEENGISCLVKPANVDEDLVKKSLLKEGATPDIISKNLAELKANKISQKTNGEIVLGADSVINLNENIISKPFNREGAMNILKKNPKITCIVGLITEPERLVDIRRNRMTSLKGKESTNYTNYEKISKEVEESKKIFKKYNWPIVDVTRKSVEETAASVIKIYEIGKENG